MKKISIFLLFLFLILIMQLDLKAEDKFPVLKGPYLGQKPPGMVPKVFAPGIISTEAAEGCSSFSRDGNFIR